MLRLCYVFNGVNDNTLRHSTGTKSFNKYLIIFVQVTNHAIRALEREISKSKHKSEGDGLSLLYFS